MNERDSVGGGSGLGLRQGLRAASDPTVASTRPVLREGMAGRREACPRPQIPPPTGGEAMTCLGCNLLLMQERCVEREGVVVCDQCEGV